MPKFHAIILLLLATLASGCGCAFAQASAPAFLPARLADSLPCVSAAADYHRVNPWVLRAILKVESDFNPSAVNRNANGTLDVGMAQINSIHFGELARWGVAPAHLLDGCTASYVAAWHLARQIRTYGNSWFGIASYHSTSPCQNTRYAGLLWNVLAAWRVVSGPRIKVPEASACRNPRPSAGQPRRGGIGSNAPAVAFDEGR
jgi:soluble lytic murein transglycosylase-like protein